MTTEVTDELINEMVDFEITYEDVKKYYKDDEYYNDKIDEHNYHEYHEGVQLCLLQGYKSSQIFDLIEKKYSDLSIENVERFGGCDMGSNAWAVWKINDKYVKFHGYYASYDGFYYEGWYWVKPVTKTIVEYE